MSERTPEETARFRKRVLAISLAAIAIPSAFWISGIVRNRPAPVERALPKSEPVFDVPATVAKVEPPREGKLTIDRETIISDSIIATKERYTAQFTIVAEEMPAKIISVTMPFANMYGVVVDASQCVGEQIQPGRGCIVNLTYDPASPNRVDGRILIDALSMRSDGSSRQISKTVALQLASVAPPAPTPVARVVANNAANEDDQAAYLRQRGRVGLLGQQTGAGHLGPQKPRDDSWTKIGFRPSVSTFPVDLSRIVTMDKPIPAVLKIPIDARSPGRAVATVERDIYGGDGRLVVIERGSTLIGTVGSSSSTSEEKLGIAWQRIVRPDGAAFAITATSGDAMGRAGVPAYIDNRWFDRFGRTVLFSVLQGGITAAVGGNTVNAQGINGSQQQQDARSTGVSIANQTITPLVQQYMREQLALPPIRTIPVGTRLTVFPTTDIMLKPIVPTDEMEQEYAAQQRHARGAAMSPQQMVASNPALSQPVQAVTNLANQASQSIQAVFPPNVGGILPGTAQPTPQSAIPTASPADAAASFATAPTAAQTLQEQTKNVGREAAQPQFSPMQQPVVGQSPFAQFYGR